MSDSKAELLVNILNGMWDTYDWTDPMNELLKDWTPELASKSLHPNITSVVAMINHTCFWEELALRNLKGESLDSLGPLSEAEMGKFPDWMPLWPETADYYRNIRGQILNSLKGMSDADLQIQLDTDSVTREYRIFSRAIHAAYHAGQLRLMRELATLPEPEPYNKSADTAPKAEGSKALLQAMMESAYQSGFSINPLSELFREISIEDANQSVEGLPTITEIVNHMAFWEDYVARRLRGEDTDNMPIAQPGSVPEGSPGWPEAAGELMARHQDVQEAFSKLTDQDLWSPMPGKGKQFEDGKSGHWLVWGIINHHAYHVGQIVLIRQMLGHREFLI